MEIRTKWRRWNNKTHFLLYKDRKLSKKGCSSWGVAESAVAIKSSRLSLNGFGGSTDMVEVDMVKEGDA